MWGYYEKKNRSNDSRKSEKVSGFDPHQPPLERGRQKKSHLYRRKGHKHYSLEIASPFGTLRQAQGSQ